ncbi:ferrous iron transport protein B [Staphylococcus felis]|uniref:ferrous iron transport protein B n=1 Tax=Staphylococcus felis TaxID=46127 RepID=UPI000CD1A65B|nr:ferrous iron transport protein B [Staphylococcus felis]AVP35707.1 ferrous iron transport protein B [Staphylococcus felis]PNZ36856.1 ferrous iron transport protein B [Staphylococcus felis]QQB04309.1 ferrous iron transport protein B [Staphylococcus felis]
MSNAYCILGNPNVGKTSLFNALTGSYEYVGNWSGVTVEKKVGQLRQHAGQLVDLPGIYDLVPISRDETVVTDYLLNEKFDGMVNIIDAAQIERNLNLTIQLLEFGAPLLIGLNMIDVAHKRGIKIDHQKLMHHLRVPIIPVIARTGKGSDDVLKALSDRNISARSPLKINYDAQLEKLIQLLTMHLPNHLSLQQKHYRFLIIQYLLDNPSVHRYLDQDIINQLNHIKSEFLEMHAIDIEHDILQYRQAYIDKLLEDTVRYPLQHEQFVSEKIDTLLTHKYLGIPIFLGIMWLIFQVTFTWIGTPLSDQLDAFIGGPLTDFIKQVMNQMSIYPALQDLVTDGIIAGVGGVLVFVPQILVLFFFISLLEDSGYMARIAVIMDRIMEYFGLNGKSFIPMIIGFGCNVPGIMAARSIEENKERLTTILVAPFMSCSARLTVYALFVSVFFKKHQAIIVLSLYVIGIIVALLISFILSKTLLKKDNSVFVIELPPYRLPSLKTLWRSTWEKSKGFVKKAGTFIFAGSVIIWLLNYAGPTGFNVPIEKSFLHGIGALIAPILAPLGFGTWQAGATLIPGFLAKEVVVSAMAIIYAVNDDALVNMISSQFSALSAYAFMIFILLYIPCLATVAAIRKETSSWKWTILAATYPLATAYVLALAVYQIGSLFV